MIVDPDVDFYTKTTIHRKTLQKTQIYILIPKCKQSRGPIFAFTLPGGAVRPTALCQLRHSLELMLIITTTLVFDKENYLRSIFRMTNFSMKSAST